MRLARVHGLVGVACLVLAAAAYAQSTAVAVPDNAPVQAAPLDEKPATWGDAKAGQSKAGACAACHGPSGAGNPGPSYPSLHGQETAYVVRRLEEYRAGTSTYKNAAHFNLMASVAKPLSDEEIRSLGSYVQGLHARAAASQAPAAH